MRVCTYIITVDSGLAPNPFWGYCTLAVCTPNHMGVRLVKGDWVIGFLSKSRGNKLLYAMNIDKVVDFNEYYRNKKYFKKRPNLAGTWQERCGDNIYYKNEAGDWAQTKTIYHRGMLEKDTKYPRAFISDKFYYFGESAITIPNQFIDLVPKRQGVKCNHDPSLAASFVNWIEKNNKCGIQGEPIDNVERTKANKKLKNDCFSRCAPSATC